jgi:deoxyribonuclease V
MNLFEYTYALVRQIPPKHLSTYGAVAEALGDKRAARAVGRMMNQNPDADTMPCFKIVYSDGSLGGFGLGIEDKIRRIQKDGIIIKDGRIVDFNQVFFNDFKTKYPLKKIQMKQQKMSKQIILKDAFNYPIKIVGGIDVAYPKNEFDTACAAYVAIDIETYDIVEKHYNYKESTFPYIPGYLSYRELPVIEAVMKNITILPQILMVDGNGILHPRKCGIACHLGIKYNIPTIGVAKRKLLGEVTNDLVLIDGEIRARSLITGRARNPIYISPGHQISLDTSYKITKQLCRVKNPEPLREAHRAAQEGLLQKR